MTPGARPGKLGKRHVSLYGGGTRKRRPSQDLTLIGCHRRSESFDYASLKRGTVRMEGGDSCRKTGEPRDVTEGGEAEAEDYSEERVKEWVAACEEEAVISSGSEEKRKERNLGTTTNNVGHIESVNTTKRGRGRPRNAERIRKDRDRSTSTAPSVKSWLFKRPRETESEDSEGDIEGKENVKRKKKKDKSPKESKQVQNSEEAKSLKMEKNEMIEILETFKREMVEELGEKISKKIEEEWKKKVEELQEENAQMRRQIQELQRKSEETEKRERKRNIVIKGVKDRVGSPRGIVERIFKDVVGENTEVKINEVFKIGKDREDIYLVKMENFDEKMKIMGKRVNLKGSEIFLDDDLTFKERERQRKIREWAGVERRKGKRVNVGYGKAYVDGMAYEWNEMRERMEPKFRGERMEVGNPAQRMRNT